MFKKNFNKTIISALVVCLGFISPVGFNTNVKAAGPEVSFTNNNDGTYTFGNQFLTRTFSINEGKVTTTAITNNRALVDNAPTVLVPQQGSEEFVITTLDNQIGGFTAPTKIENPAPGNAETGWKATSDSEEQTEAGHGNAQQIFDGNAETFYHSQYKNGTQESMNLPHNIFIDLKQPYEISSFSYEKRLSGGNTTNNGHLAAYKFISYANQEDFNARANGTVVAEGTFEFNKDKKVEYANFNQKVNTQFLQLVITGAHNPTDPNHSSVVSIGELTFSNETVVFPKDTIRSSELTLANDPVFSNGTLTFTYNPITVRGVDYTISQVLTMKDGESFMKKHLEISVPAEMADKAVINYIDLENMKFTAEDTVGDGNANSGTATNYWTIPNQANNGWMGGMQGRYLELGQPYYVGAMYWGCEFPMTENKIRGNEGDKTGFIRYHYGKNLTVASNESDGHFELYKNYNGANGQSGKMVTWDSVVGAARSRDYQVCQADFYNYIETIATPTNFRQQYNSWYDNMKEINNTNILESFAEVERGFTQYGIEPLDSYVVDDGWVNYNSFWGFNDKFPNQLYDSQAQVEQMGSQFGLWLGPRGGYGTEDDISIAIQNMGEGSRNHQSGGDINISDSRYLNKLTRDIFLEYQNNFNINYWKLDGMLLNPSTAATEYHVTGSPFYTISETYERWTDMFERMRDARGDKGLWINLTSYVNPSPWLLRWVNSVWMQNTGDGGFIYHVGNNVNSDQQAQLTYRDTSYYEFFHDRQWQLPNKYFYNHDPVFGKTANTAPGGRPGHLISHSTEEFRNHLYMLGTRGTAFWEYYYSPSMLDDAKWQVNAEAAKWIQENFDVLQNSKMFGNKPSVKIRDVQGDLEDVYEGEAYGFSCWNNEKGIVSLRNSDDTAKTIEVKFDRLIGVPEGISNLYGKVVIGNVDKYQADLNANPLSYDQTRTYTLDPNEVLIIEYAQKDTSTPTIDKVRVGGKIEVEQADRTKQTVDLGENTLRVTFSETIRNDFTKDSFTVKEDGAILRTAGYTVTNAELEADQKTVRLTLDKPVVDLSKITVTSKGIKDITGNGDGLDATYVKEHYSDNTVTSIINNDLNGTAINKGSEYSISGKQDFSVIAKINTQSTNATIAEQVGAFKLAIDAEGYVTFEFNGMTINSKHDEKVITNGVVNTTTLGKVNDGANHNIVAVKEVNGMIKLYIDGKVVASAYEADKANPEVVKGDVKFGEGLTGHAQLITLTNNGVSHKDVTAYTTTTKNVAALSNGGTITKYFDRTTNSNADVNQDNPVNNMIDGNIGTFGEFKDNANNEKHSRFVEVKLKEAYNLDSFKLVRYHADTRLYGNTVIALYDGDPEVEGTNKLVIYNSDKDDVHGFGVGTAPYYTETADGLNIDLATIEGAKDFNTKYIRVYVNGRDSNTNKSHDHINEIQAFGEVAGTPMPHRVDYTQLQHEVDQYNKLDEKAYTPDSVKAYKENLKTTLEEAQKVLADKKETNTTKIDSLVAKFKAEKATLVARANYDAAKNLLEVFSKLNEKDYTKSSWKEFVNSKAEDNLKDAINNENISQADLDAVVKASADSQALLALRADVTKAKEALDASKDLVKKDYTKDSWKAFVDAKKALEAVVKNNSDTNQAQLDELLAKFNTALKGLEKVSVDKPTQPEKPKPTVKPEPTKKPVANGNGGYDDGGPFTTDKCGSVYDRWGNLMWKAPACNAQANDGYNIVNTNDR